jgi:hypothetical protein
MRLGNPAKRGECRRGLFALKVLDVTLINARSISWWGAKLFSLAVPESRQHGLRREAATPIEDHLPLPLESRDAYYPFDPTS